MAWSIPTTVKVGDIIDATIWNTYGRDNLNYLHDNSWFKLSETILSGTATNITFSSISGFTHLMILGALRADDAALLSTLNMQINSDTGANYSYNTVEVNSAANTSFSNRNQTAVNLGKVSAATATANVFSIIKIIVSNYTNTFAHKAFNSKLATKQAQAANTDLFYYESASWWQSTSTLTAIKIFLNSGANLVSGSYLDLYGLS